jgi:hypothetical protein
MVRVTKVHMVGGELHEHIAEVSWVNPASLEVGRSSRAGMIVFLEKPGGRAVVGEGANQVDVGVVQATPKYIRTHADGRWTNNLLSLPRY